MGLLNLYNASQTQLKINDPDLVTSYPSTVTGKPNMYFNPAAAKNFDQFWFADYTYLDFNPIKGISSGILKNTLKVTNLDTSHPLVDGGIPYKEVKDPTVYPTDTNHSEPIRGYFAQPGVSSNKFYQSYSETNTYSDFIKNYI